MILKSVKMMLPPSNSMPPSAGSIAKSKGVEWKWELPTSWSIEVDFGRSRSSTEDLIDVISPWESVVIWEPLRRLVGEDVLAISPMVDARWIGLILTGEKESLLPPEEAAPLELRLVCTVGRSSLVAIEFDVGKGESNFDQHATFFDRDVSLPLLSS